MIERALQELWRHGMIELACLSLAVLLPFVVGYLNQRAIRARYTEEKSDG